MIQSAQAAAKRLAQENVGEKPSGKRLPTGSDDSSDACGAGAIPAAKKTKGKGPVTWGDAEKVTQLSRISA